MNRNFYFIGIAFFGMINGIFNQLLLIFALLYVQLLAGPLLFGSLSLTLMFASLMVSTATVILGGIPAAIYERVTGASESNNASLWIWLAGTALLALPAAGNFLQDRPLSALGSRRLRARQRLRATLAAVVSPRIALASDGVADHGRDAAALPMKRCCAPAASHRSPSSAS